MACPLEVYPVPQAKGWVTQLLCSIPDFSGEQISSVIKAKCLTGFE